MIKKSPSKLRQSIGEAKSRGSDHGGDIVKAEWYHVALLAAVIGSQSSIAFSSAVISSFFIL